jgi:hypothetical protein
MTHDSLPTAANAKVLKQLVLLGLAEEMGKDMEKVRGNALRGLQR